MMEIINVTTGKDNKAIQTGSVQLDKACNKIFAEMKRGNKASHVIAKELHNISVNSLFTQVADNFSDFAEQYFGLSKSRASRYVKVAERFLQDNKFENYTITQLTEMLRATDEMIEYINPSMTCTEIRNYITGALALTDNSDDTETTDNSEETETTDNSDDTETTDNSEETENKEDDIALEFSNEKELSAFVQKIFKAQLHIKNVKVTFEYDVTADK